MSTAVRVMDLRVDGRADQPLGVDDRRPSLSWRMRGGTRQRSYRVVVAVDESDLAQQRYLWDSGEVESDAQCAVYRGDALASRQRVVWCVRVRDVGGESAWSVTASWEMGLLHPEDWGDASWVEHPTRDNGDPLPLFARQFAVTAPVAAARLFVCGIGVHEVSLNGRAVTGEVLAPGNSNYQRSVEYRTYDVTGQLRRGSNTLGVRLGHGTAHVHREGANSRRRSVYSWWTSQSTGRGELRSPAKPGETFVRTADVTGYRTGGTLNLGRGTAMERRRIVAVHGGDAATSGVMVEPALTGFHPEGSEISGSGEPVADLDPSAGAAVSPRLIARLEIYRADGAVDVEVSGPTWRTALGPALTDNWFSGTDYDARREQPDWDAADADLTVSARRRDGSATGWVEALVTASPSLDTVLVWRAAQPVRVVDARRPVGISQPRPGTWVFDFGRNLAGWPELRLGPGVPVGTVVMLRPAECLRADGTVDQDSIRDPARGTDVFHTYTARGGGEGETWRPSFQYFGMRYLEVTGFPPDCAPTSETIRALRVRADLPAAGEVVTSNARVNRIHRMVGDSIASNAMSVLTDCPGREKLAYGADYTHPMGVLARHFDFSAYLRTMQRHLAEGQSRRGNVALKAPVYDWGYTGQFGDEINWGNAIVLVPWILYRWYGDVTTMARFYGNMRAFLRYIATNKVGRGEDPTGERATGRANTTGKPPLVTGPLGDWMAAESTSGELTGTWGYFVTASVLSRMAAVLARLDGAELVESGGHDNIDYAADARFYDELATDIRSAFHERFFVAELGCYSGDRTADGATQAAQALALDAGLVPDEHRAEVLDALVRRVRQFQPHGGGPHLSAGHIGLGPTVRVLTEARHDELLWEVLQEDTPPSYGNFLRPRTSNPDGLSTIPERWDLDNSLNHMILTQIDEWFHTGLGGIRQAPRSVGFREVVIDPRPVGDLDRVEAFHRAPAGRIAVRWRRRGQRFAMDVEIPPNTTARVRVPGLVEKAPRCASQQDSDGYLLLAAGTCTFRSLLPPTGTVRNSGKGTGAVTAGDTGQ